jgi:hypothetical protein
MTFHLLVLTEQLVALLVAVAVAFLLARRAFVDRRRRRGRWRWR